MIYEILRFYCCSLYYLRQVQVGCNDMLKILVTLWNCETSFKFLKLKWSLHTGLLCPSWCGVPITALMNRRALPHFVKPRIDLCLKLQSCTEHCCSSWRCCLVCLLWEYKPCLPFLSVTGNLWEALSLSSNNSPVKLL